MISMTLATLDSKLNVSPLSLRLLAREEGVREASELLSGAVIGAAQCRIDAGRNTRWTTDAGRWPLLKLRACELDMPLLLSESGPDFV
jgi:hypothetical protein